MLGHATAPGQLVSVFVVTFATDQGLLIAGVGEAAKDVSPVSCEVALISGCGNTLALL
jgi:hypothetical protein